MNERRRMQYLEAMGIDSFVPRFLLPAAKNAVMCSPPETMDTWEAQSPAASAKTSAKIHQHSPSVDVLSSQPPVLPEASVKPATQIASSEQSACFSLALWRVGRYIQVIDSRQQGDALPTQALLSNILQAVGVLELNLPKVETLNWPMFDNSSDNSWQAARQMVQGFLEGRLSNTPVSHLLLFGEEASKVTLGEDAADQVFHECQAEAFSANAFVLPSLSAILYRPELKFKVWAALKGLGAKLPHCVSE